MGASTILVGSSPGNPKDKGLDLARGYPSPPPRATLEPVNPTRIAAALLWTTSWLLCTPSARAQPSPPRPTRTPTRSRVPLIPLSRARSGVDAVRRLKPGRSLARLAEWFEGRGQLERAWEITAFALAHDRHDPDALLRAARLNLALGDPATARHYAREVLARRAGDARALAVLEAAGGTPGAPGPEAEGAGAAGTDAPAEDAETDEAADEEGAAEDEPAVSLDRKLRVLGLMKTLRSAVRTYDLRHPRTPMETLDLDALREDKLLPADFAPEELGLITLEDGTYDLVGVGTLDALQDEVGSFRKRLAEAERWLADGHPHEALEDLEALRADFGPSARLSLALGRARRALGRDEEGEADDSLGPGHALQEAVELWRSGRREPAREALDALLKRWPEGGHAAIARHLRRLVGQGYALDQLERFYQLRHESLAASEATTDAAEGEGEASEDAEADEAGG